jgi:MoaA/NifB/PqqE/SkfB family radical SAM enzyme
MCGACDYSPGNHGMLSTEEWKGVIDSAVELRTVLISLTGGEALIRKDLFELIRYARSKGIAVHLNSNGTFLTDRIVDRLSDAGLDSLSVSLDGPTKEPHEEIRGEDTFDRTVAGIRNVRKRAPEIDVGLNSVLNTGNYKELRGYIPLANELGVGQVKFMPIHTNLQHKDKDVEEFSDMIFADKDLEDLDGEIQTLQRELEQAGIMSTSRAFFKGMTSLYRPPNSNFYCYAGYATCVIDHQGFVGPCFDKDGSVSVREKPLHEIWRSEDFEVLRHKVRTCEENCWDTTNAEISLRFSILNSLGDIRQTARDLRFYLSGGRKACAAPANGGSDGTQDDQAEKSPA